MAGLSADVADPPAVFLSPRGREVGRELADRFPNVTVCGSNQAVLESAATIVLAVRPQVARSVVPELSFRSGHVVLSAMAGVRVERLREWAAPAGRIVRVLPLPQAARRQSLTVMYPDDPAGRDLFTRVGDVLVPTDESTLEAFTAATAALAAHIDYVSTIADWLAGQGVESGAATAYAAHIFGQLGQSLSRLTGSLTELTGRHMTPGGINEQVLTDLRRDGVPDLVRHALDRVLTRLRG